MRIRLEYEAAFDWLAIVPLWNGDEGALTKYFGKDDSADEDDSAYKYRGIDRRQRSTLEWIMSAQEELIETLDQSRSPEAVCARLQGQLTELRSGRIDPAVLTINNRASKHVDEYRHSTRTVAALERAADGALDLQPGRTSRMLWLTIQSVRVTVFSSSISSPIDMTLKFYADLLIRVAESVCSPLG